MRSISSPLALALTTVVIAASPAGFAQTSGGYLKSVGNAPFVPLTGGTVAQFLNDDDGSTIVPIGFPFTYFGVSYTHVNIGTNGGLVLAAPCVSAADCGLNGRCVPGGCRVFLPPQSPTAGAAMPSTQAPDLVIAAAWDDLRTSPGQVTHATVGVAGSRELVVQWQQVQHASNAATTFTFQIRLDEATGAIRLHYGSFVGASPDPWGAVAGLEDATGTTGDLAFACGANPGRCRGPDLATWTNQRVQWIEPQGAELVPSGLAPTGAAPGGAAPVQVQISNVGASATSTAVLAELWLSTDATLDPADQRVATVSFPPLGPSGVATRTATASFPVLAPGYYRLFLRVDPADRVPEVDETNNTLLLERNFPLGSELSAQVFGPPTTGPGAPLDVGIDFLNAGASEPAVLYRLYFSRDQTLDVSDRLVATGTIALAAVPITRVTLTDPTPVLPPGDYWPIVEVDPLDRIAELDETNNVSVGGERTVVSGPDLRVRSVTVPAPFGIRGEPLAVQALVENSGDGAAVGFRYRVHVSQSTVCTAQDPLLGGDDGLQLAPGASLSVDRTFPLPASLPLGSYYLCLLVNDDRAVVEENETNNNRRTATTFEVRDPLPDLTVTRVRVPSEAGAGETIAVERAIVNVGRSAATAAVRAYLSEDDVLDPAVDPQLLSGTVTLDPGDDDLGVDRARLPSSGSSGPHRIIYVVDPDDAVFERDEANNVFASEPFELRTGGLRIVTQTLPAGARGAPYEVQVVASGALGPVQFSVGPQGLPAGLTLQADGLLMGRPEQEGLFDIDLRANDGFSQAQATLPLLVTGPTTELQVASRVLPAGHVGRAYAAPLVALGGAPPYQWQVPQDVLPPGLTAGDDGEILGVPEAPALSTLDVQVTDALGATASRTLALRILGEGDQVRWSDDALPDGRAGEAYSAALRATGGTPPYRFELARGDLPAGLTLSTSALEGTPEAAGRHIFDLRVTDAARDFDINRYVVEVLPTRALGFGTATLPDGRLAEAYLDADGEPVRIEASGVGEVRLDVVSGALPNGLRLNLDGAISGTPSLSGQFTFVVRAQDDLTTAYRAYGLRVTTLDDVGPIEPAQDGCTNVGAGPGAWWLLIVALWWGRRRRAAMGVTLALLLLSTPAAAQTGGYAAVTETAPYTVVGGRFLTFDPADPNDDEEVVLPFGFSFFEQTYDRVHVGRNGLVVLGSGRAFDDTNDALPASTPPNGLIAPWWDDLTGTTVQVLEHGQAPGRVFVIQFAGATWAQGSNAGTLAFQVRLFEGPMGRFDVHYGPIVGLSAPNAYSATTGFEGENGVFGGPLLTCPSPNCDGTDFRAARDQVVRVRRDLGTDVVALEATGPVEIVPTVPFEVSVGLESRSAQTLGPFSVAVHLLAPSDPTPSRPVFTSTSVQLDPFGRVRFGVDAVAPLATPPGRYRLALVVDSDDVIAEPNEADNTWVSPSPVRVRAPSPSYTVDSVAADQSAAQPGDAVRVTANLQNLGPQAGEVGWRVVLSSNPIASPDDRGLAEGRLTLAAGGAAPLDEVVTLPADLPAGRHWLGVVVDPNDEVAELDELDNAAASGPILVTHADLTVLTTALPAGLVGLRYAQRVEAAGGDGTYAWRVADGALPDGLTLDGDGEIRGAPTTAGSSSFTVAVDSDGRSAQAALTLEITETSSGLALVTRNLVPGLLGESYPPVEPGAPREGWPRIEAVGASGPVTFSSTATPPGLTLDPDGLLLGVPERADDYRIPVTVSDGADEVRGLVNLTVAVPGRLTLVAAALPDARLGELYEARLRVLGAQPGVPVEYSASTLLPEGLVLTTTGTLAGVPRRTQTATFAVSARQGPVEDSAVFWLTVEADDAGDIEPTDPTISGGVGAPLSVDLRATDVLQGNLRWSVSGEMLPAGLEGAAIADEGTRRFWRVSGTPTAAGRATFLLEVTDEAGRNARRGYTVQITEPDTPPVDSGGCRTGGSAPLALLLLPLLWARRHRRDPD